MGFMTAPEFRKIRAWLRWIVGILLLLGLGGAWIGLTRIATPGSDSVTDKILAELGLMAGNWQPETTQRLPWSLSVAQTIVPLATTGLVVLIFADILGWAKSMSRNHTVLVGDGAAAKTIAQRLRAPGGDKGRKQRVLTTQLGDRAALLANGVKRARKIVVVGDSAFDTATNVTTTAEAMKEAKREDFAADLLVGDPALALALRARRLVQVADRQRRLRIFTVDELAARRHAQQLSFNGGQSHILVVGSSAFGKALIVEFAKRWAGRAAAPGETRPVVTVVARDAQRAIDDITGRWPFVAATCELRPREEPLEQAMLSIPDRPERTYFCDEDEEKALRDALTAATRWRSGDGSIVVRLTRLAPESNSDLFGRLGGALAPISVYDDAAAELLVESTPFASFGQAIHESYLRDALLRGEALGSRSNLVPWEQLSPDVKALNEAQAANFLQSLSKIHSTVAPRTRLADPFFLRPGDVEALAKVEHEHWLTQRKDRRKRYGARRGENDTELVPWEQLSEAARSRNRAIVRARPQLFDALLEKEGLQIVRLGVDESAVPATPSWLTPAVVDRLAELIHTRFLQAELAKGVQLGSRPSMHPWHELGPDLVESNRAQARDIASKLDVIEATVTSTPPATPFAFSADEIEMLARYEHDRWVSQRIAAGWTYGKERDDSKKIHNLLVPWLYLGHDQHEKDRGAVTEIPSLVAAAGLYIVRR